jgi:CHASE3 domain sensor protein
VDQQPIRPIAQELDALCADDPELAAWVRDHAPEIRAILTLAKQTWDAARRPPQTDEAPDYRARPKK